MPFGLFRLRPRRVLPELRQSLAELCASAKLLRLPYSSRRQDSGVTADLSL
jgi:hypothetical protein